MIRSSGLGSRLLQAVASRRSFIMNSVPVIRDRSRIYVLAVHVDYAIRACTIISAPCRFSFWAF
jgi:hypothetical protein